VGCSTAVADSGFGIADALSDIVKGGIDKFLIGFADNLYEQSYRPDGTTTFNGTTTEIWIYKITTYTPDPTKNAGVMSFLKNTLLLVVVYCFLYTGIGLIYVLLAMVAPSKADLIDGMLNRSNMFRTTRIKEYFENLLVTVSVLGFTGTAMSMLFALNYFITSFFIISCFQVKSLAPSTDNAILYLMISIFYYMLNSAMFIRGILLYIFVMGCFIIGALLISNKTRDLGFSVGWYFVGILFLQSIIVFLTTAGFIGVEAMCAESGIVAGTAAEIGLYLFLLIILFIAVISIMIGLVRFRKAAVKTVRLAI
jgi:hypothetical protein